MEQIPRWRLTQPHYLNVPGTEWEYKETSRDSGKTGRKIFEVPQYLNPNDPADHNYPGEIIVSHGLDRQFPKDIVFVGKPTGDMEPLNEEADKISEEESKNWQHPVDTLPAQGNYSQSLLVGLEAMLSKAMEANPPKNL
jgi:hypothetical protein